MSWGAPLGDLATIEAGLATAEAQIPRLRDGCAKRILWAGQPATKTAIAVVYIHGFSATAEELRPLPDLVAKELGANLYFSRLTGHGQDGVAMGAATLEDWQADIAEALKIGQTIGDAVIVIGCSTGCTLLTLAMAQGAKVKAAVYISPNFGLRNRIGQVLLDLPGSRVWAKYLASRTVSLPAVNAAHSAYWTLHYPLAAVHAMGDAVRAARKADLGRIKVPALFCFNAADRVVDPAKTRQVIARWGGSTGIVMLDQQPQDDRMGHVMAGDVFSSGQTLPLAKRILAWLAQLPAT